jgi:N-acetylglucosaminyl-diphospho-decaprenol L-rhamnosyltransferase
VGRVRASHAADPPGLGRGLTTVPRLTIVIVSYNSRLDLDRCLRSISANRPSVDYAVIVADNDSRDDTVGHLRSLWPGVAVVETGGNVGFSKANNVAIRLTTSELVLILNPDTELKPGAIDRLIAVLDADAGIAIAGPRLVDGEGRGELSFGRMIAPVAELRQRLLVRGSDRGSAGVSRLVERMTRQSRDVDWVSGACMLARRADIAAAGLFDERFFMYMEDVDLCAAVRGRGRRVRFVADAEVVHFRGRSVASAPAATQRAYRRSHVEFYAKHHRGWLPWLRLYLKLSGELPDK